MCLTCGCCKPTLSHDDSRNFTIGDLEQAAQAASISIAQAGSNIASTLAGCSPTAKSSRESTQGVLLKADDEKRVALFVAYPVNKADTAVAADGHIDFASKTVVEQAAWNWMAKGARLGLWHKVSTDDFETVESGLHHGPDWVIKAADGSERVVVDGDWLISVRAKTDHAWQMVKAGLIGGASPQGSARRRTPSAEALANLRS